jgi:recombinational DNA repair ATPase RecF
MKVNIAPDKSVRQRLNASYYQRWKLERMKNMYAEKCVHGPHRDDIRYFSSTEEMPAHWITRTTRTIVLALKIAEIN